MLAIIFGKVSYKETIATEIKIFLAANELTAKIAEY